MMMPFMPKLETKTAKTTTTTTTGKTALEMEGVSTTSTAAKWIKSSMMAAASAHLFKILSSVKSRPFIVISKNLINFTKVRYYTLTLSVCVSECERDFCYLGTS